MSFSAEVSELDFPSSGTKASSGSFVHTGSLDEYLDLRGFPSGAWELSRVCDPKNTISSSWDVSKGALDFDMFRRLARSERREASGFSV